jgi:hypothetical protein
MAQRDVLVEADEASVVSEMAAEHMSYRLVECDHLLVIVDPELRRDVVASAVVECQLE